MTRPGPVGAGAADAGALAAARTKVGRPARAIVDDVTVLARRADQLAGAGASLRERIRR